MKAIFVLCAFVLVSSPMIARPGQGVDPLTGRFVVMVDSSAVDTPAAPHHRSLLPANISWAEKFLWDEHGFMRNIGIASPLTPEVRKHELEARRTMLTMHQIGGFVTVGMMGAAVYFGQKTLDNPGTRSYRGDHQTFVTASIISYGVTGLLAALSPPPYIRRDEVSTTSIHKTLAWVHFGGMVLTPILGSFIKGRMSYNQVAHFHQVSAYITFAALTASMVVITL